MKTRILYLLIAAQIFCAVFGCGKIETGANAGEIKMNNEVSAAVSQAAAKKRGNAEQVKISLTDSAKFDWDKVFVFAPHTPHTLIEEKIGAGKLPKTALADIESRDDICLLIFTKNGKPVQAAELNRGQGDFSKIASGESFTPATAVFDVREEDRGEPWITVYPAK